MSEPARATKACQFCGEQILAVAIKCRHCGSVLNQAAMAATTKPPEAVGIILVLTPFVAGIIMYIVISNMTLLERPLDTMNGFLLFVVAITTVLIGVDAWMLKQSKGDGPPATSWIVLSILLWIIGYPAYLSARSKFGAKTLVVGGIFAMLFFLGIYGLLYSVISDKLSEVQRALQAQ